MVSKGSQRGLGLPSLWLACELRAISVLIARFGVTCPYTQIKIKIRLGINHIIKEEFLPTFLIAYR
jgi:hypothetical protein